MTCEECGRDFTPKPRSRPDQRYCRTTCRQVAWARRKYATDPVFAKRQRARTAKNYDRLVGLAYAKRLLQTRRANALWRHRRRSVGAAPAPRD